uniref:Scaffold protein Nfu/NifU N-terminal domain-containing protein n=1 Tax=Fagus sylvatica TaxID=28930 RepID=A0A2N9GG22_FAGSY
MKGFGRLIGRALSYSSQQTQLKPLSSRRRLIHAASSSAATTSYLDNKTTSSSSYSSPLRSSPIPSLHSRRKWAGPFGGQRRTMFIQTQSTPNPASLMFYPGKPVMDVGSADFPNARAAMNSPLAKVLFGVDDGSLYLKYGHRVVYDAASTLNVKLSSMLRDMTWFWNTTRSNDLVMIWKPWDQITYRALAVRWWRLVWFAKSISRHAFICRLAVRVKLTTKDRMAKWGFGGVLLCVMQIEIGEQKLVPNSIKMPF